MVGDSVLNVLTSIHAHVCQRRLLALCRIEV